MKRILLSLVCVAALAATAAAHDFTVNANNSKLFFNITDTAARTAEVTFEGSIAQKKSNTLEGKLRIPATVKHNNTVYTITAIGPKALAGATKLTSVVLPSSIKKIGDFAFEGCTALKSVVFPGAPVAFGQGTFFRCTALRNLSLGSDWTQVDFSMFRWSDSLQSVAIPARVQKIQGLKTLRRLQHIDVDVNNTRYAADGGSLYDKAFQTLFCVPRDLQGKLEVRPGTTTILWGAIIDCAELTHITLPASVQKLSFREFYRLTKLQELTCLAETPIATTTVNGRDTTLFVVANPAVQLLVPKTALKAWKTAMNLPAGDYQEIAANKPEGITDQQAATPYHIESSQMIAQKNIKGFKN